MEVELSDATGESKKPNSQDTISFNVKFSGRSVPVSLSPDSTIKDLKSFLQPVTNVLPRGQKLIFKGKLLVDNMTLKASNMTNGSKLMLMASQGLHQGDGPILKEVRPVPVSRRVDNIDKKVVENKQHFLDKNRLDRWKATGVIALSDSNLKAIPDEVWACGSFARILDFSNNSIRVVPAQIDCFSGVQKLFLNANDILDESISWEGLRSLKRLTVLSMNQNHLTTLPPELGSLTSLRLLHVSNNKLCSLPSEIGLLTELEVLTANNNRIITIAGCIGNCSSLIEVDLSSNLLSELPETFSKLINLKMCLQLSTLDLHNTEITIDLLRQFEGWNTFDERRCLKHQKQLDFRVDSSAKFDEGADKD